jgi:hypothetical protein
MMRKITTKKRFEAWLREQPESARFGRSVFECPLARYAGTGVSYRSYGGQHGTREITPKWATRYAKRFDRGRRTGKAAALRALRAR